MEFFYDLNEWINEFLLSAGVFAPIFSSILIVLEGVLAFLPLFVFITLNILVLGAILGGALSWICTVIGCFFTFYLCRIGLSTLFQKKIEDNKQLNKIMDIVDNLKFRQLVVFIAIPFMPSFFINVAAGLSNIPIKKYLYALLIGKVVIVIFWGFLGYNLVECLTNPIELVKVVLLVAVAYIIARFVNRKFDLDERF